MSPRFWRTLGIVAAVHVAAVLALLTVGGVRSCGRKPEFVQPIEFLVEVPPSLQENTAPEALESAPESESAPEPEPVKHDAVEPPPEPKPGRAPIERSTKTVVRKADGRPPVAPLSEEEIRKLLARGAKPSDRTVIPEETDICFALVRKAFYDAWLQPSREEAGDAAMEMAISIGAEGVVLSRVVRRASGNAKMDASVIAAANTVKNIHGLTPAFIAAHPVVTVLFKLEQGR
jgi:hypothetical protein